MASAITVHDNRLYIGLPMPCDFCEGDHPLHGTVVSMALDGTDRQVVARGLRYPAGMTVYHDALWITDTARDGLRGENWLDEINRVSLTCGDNPTFWISVLHREEQSPGFAS